jgi:RNA polymerase sigma factor (sigma-70 family)
MATSIAQNLTHESLLLRLKNVYDSEAWDTFYQNYKGLIVSYSRRQGCSNQMSQDVLQETLITLTKVMPTFEYNQMKGRFRYFLLTIVKSRIIDAFRRERRHTDHQETTDYLTDSTTEILDRMGASDWESAWDKEWEQHLLLHAVERIKKKVKPHIFESFRLYVLEKHSADQVSEILGIPKDNIYEHRRRLVAMLREEVASLRADLGE